MEGWLFAQGKQMWKPVPDARHHCQSGAMRFAWVCISLVHPLHFAEKTKAQQSIFWQTETQAPEIGSLCSTTNQAGLIKSVLENSGRKGSPALQLQGVGPRLYSAVPTVSSGATPKGTEFALDFSLGETQAQKARGLAG